MFTKKPAPARVSFVRQSFSGPSAGPSYDIDYIDEVLSIREFERRAFSTPQRKASKRTPQELEKILAEGCTSKDARAYYAVDKSAAMGEENRYENIWAYDRTALRLPKDLRKKEVVVEESDRFSTMFGRKKTDDSVYLNANVCRDAKGSFWVISQAPLPEGFHPFFLSMMTKQASTKVFGTSAIPSPTGSTASLSRRSSIGSLAAPSVKSAKGFSGFKIGKSLKRKTSGLKEKAPEEKQKRHVILVQLASWIEDGKIKADPYIPEAVGHSLQFEPDQRVRMFHPTLTFTLNSATERKELASTYSTLTLTSGPLPGATTPGLNIPMNSYSSHTSEKGYFPSTSPTDPDILQSLRNIDMNSTGLPTPPATTAPSLHSSTTRSALAEQLSPMVVHHFLYHAFPDHGVPAGENIRALRRLAEEVGALQRNLECEVWMHCSAGVGRSGTFVAMSSLLCEPQIHPYAPAPKLEPSPLAALPDWLVDDPIATTIDTFREQRSWLLEKKEQVELVYKVVIDGLGK